MKSFIRNVKIVIIFTIIAKLASFVSEIIIANYLGTTARADAYSMISGIHAVIYPILGLGVWSVFLPEYQRLKTTDINLAKKYADGIITLFIILSSTIGLITFLFADGIINCTSPGFDSDTRMMAATLLRIYSPYFVFSTISSIFAAMLQSHGKFVGSQLRELVSYLPLIVLGPILFSNIGVNGFVIALLIGGFLRLVVQFPFINWGYRYKPTFKFRDASIKKSIKKMPSVLVVSGSDQVLTFVDKMMASTQAIGSVASLNYGVKLVNAANGIITNSISVVLFPEMPKMLAKKQYEELSSLLVKILTLLSIIIFPIMSILMIYSSEIVRMVYARGSFDENSVVVTSAVFCGYLIGFYFIGIKQIIDKVFYSLEKNNTIMILNIINVVLNVVLNVLLMNWLGLAGLAYATSISSIVYILLCLVFLRKSKLRLNIVKLLKKILFVMVLSITVTFVSSWLLSFIGIASVVRMIIATCVSIVICILAYKIVSFEEYLFLSKKIKSMIKGRRIKTVKQKTKKKKVEFVRRASIAQRVVFGLLILAQAIFSVLLVVSLIQMQILPLWMIVLIGVILATLFIVFLLRLVIMRKAPSRVTRATCVVASLLMIFASAFALRYTGSFNGFLSKITTKTTETKWYSVVVPTSSEIKEIKDLDNKIVGMLKTDAEADVVNEYLAGQVSFKVDYYDGIDTALDVLVKNLGDAAVVEAERYDVFAETAKDYVKNLKVAFEFRYTYDKESENQPVKQVTTEPFTVLISGSDSRIGIKDKTARSDVNIVVVVNPAKGKMLLATVPRDTYVQLHGTTGIRDKLTHAGLYGVEMSKATLEDFLKIKIDYTIKVSFQTVVRIVDELDGVEIFSDTEMTLNAWSKVNPKKKCYYPYGPSTVDGECALRFARERKMYYRGDKHRGENQQEVLKGIITKLTNSKEYLLKLPQILDIAADSFETSFTRDEISSFIRLQLAEGIKWKVDTIGVDGEGKMLPTYTLGSNWPLYVMIADEKSVEATTAKINEYLEN